MKTKIVLEKAYLHILSQGRCVSWYHLVFRVLLLPHWCGFYFPAPVLNTRIF
jgi:hypothetical protein